MEINREIITRINNGDISLKEQLYNSLNERKRRVLNEYYFLNMPEDKYEIFCKKAFEYVLKNKSNSKFDVYYIQILKVLLNKHCGELLQRKDYDFIYRFVDSLHDNEPVISQINRFNKFINNVGLSLNIEDYSNLIKNEKISNWFKNIIGNKEVISESLIDKYGANPLIASFIYAYCFKENIDIIEDEKEIDNAEISTLDTFKTYINDIKVYPVLNREKEQELFIRLANGDEKARELIINSNLRLVISIAKRFLNSGMPFMDLIQEGNLGLMKSIDRFDYTKGYKFSTYTTWWIRQSIQRSIGDKARIIRLPIHLNDQVLNYNKACAKFCSEFGYNPTYEQIAEYMGISVEKVAELSHLQLDPLSLNSKIIEEGDDELSDFIEDKSCNVEEEVINNVLPEAILELMRESLNEREFFVISQRYGIGTNDRMTLEEVGKQLGVTRERIRQIEAKALRRMRNKSVYNHKCLTYFRDFL